MPVHLRSWHHLWSSKRVFEIQAESVKAQEESRRISELLLVSSYPVAQRCTHLRARGRLVSGQCTAALGKESFGRRCGLNPGHIMPSANLPVVFFARSWGCAHVHRLTYAFHLLLCGSRHRSCFSCVGSVIYSGSCVVQYCLQ